MIVKINSNFRRFLSKLNFFSFSSLLLSNCNLRNFFRIPHNIFKLSAVTLLALLSVQLKLDVALICGQVQIKPKCHTSLHRGPTIPTVLLMNRKAMFCCQLFVTWQQKRTFALSPWYFHFCVGARDVIERYQICGGQKRPKSRLNSPCHTNSIPLQTIKVSKWKNFTKKAQNVWRLDDVTNGEN